MPVPSDQQREIDRLVEAYAAASSRLRTELTTILEQQWRSLGTYHEDDVPRFLAIALPLVVGAMRQMASLTDAYLAQYLSILAGRTVLPRGVSRTLDEVDSIRGIPMDEEYRRPFRVVWQALKDGKPLPD